ncbi:uncharacterized protein LOC119103133 [Pollicipes pollicipes]|uniref:uncharacterized protein LOC119103133 n=1 Tax=Pollicipes pollicipes TaxID=41117 RepID=UPI0018850BBC|nr:uncharacterized protein LOC119103133 [Pollicipes pollicipes]
MDFMLHDATNLTTLFSNISSWRGDDVNMTRSIAVMNVLFGALQDSLDGDASLLERYGVPASGFNLRPVRRTWGQDGAQPYRRAPPVVHQYRPAVDHRFLGSRAACGSCEFFMLCWMSGGTVRGGCGGFMFGCCERGRRAAKSFNPPPPQVDYGPVRNDPGCGLSDTSRIGITRRIVGGNQAGFGTFPWQAYILIGTSRCGGSLINQQHVLTAGHCVASAGVDAAAPDCEHPLPTVVHQYRPAVDHRFLGSRAACGSCEFFMLCWMSGGTVRGGCGGFMFGCCERGRRAAKSFNPPPPQVDYGPVRNDPGCGLSDTSRIGITRRIVGGNQAGFGTFPWQAYILIGTSRCGGSLINQQHVLTAGHCVARARPGQITITLGDYVLNSNREPLPAYKFGVRAINVHPRFQFTPQADRYDVAVLTLDRPVPYVPHIQPICLPEKGDEFEGYYGWAAGWGALRPGSRVRPKELQVVDVPVINRHMCEQWHRQKGINVIIHDEMMCAGYINGGKDSCQGDSGGPLMIENDGRWYLMGIVSAGYSCAQGKQPGIYHRVSMTSDWISYVAGN